MPSVNLTLNDNLININEGDISNEKGVLIHNIISNKDHLETSKQARYNLLYLHNRNHNTIVWEDVSEKINNTTLDYNVENGRLIQ